MRICVKRSVSVYPQYKDKFFELMLKSIEEAKNVMGVEPKPFVELLEKPDKLEVKVFTKFESLAQYEEVFLHKMLKSDMFLDGAESAVGMIHDNPRDEMLVNLEVDDYFMNRHGQMGFEDLSSMNTTNDQKYRIERLFCSAAGRLRETMAVNFAFNLEFAKKAGRLPEYYCTRFAADRIGSSETMYDFNDCQLFETAFREHDRMIAEKHPGMLLRPTVDTLYRRVTEDMIGQRMLDEHFAELERRIAA